MRHSHAVKDIECEEAAPAEADIHHFPAKKIQSVMDPRIYKIALVCWIGFLSVFWLTFWMSANALFMVVVSTVYAVMFFGVPYEMSRIYPGPRRGGRSFWSFMRKPFQTRTGVMQGYEVLLQVILVPVLLTIGGTAIGIIIHLARAAH